MGSSPRQVRYDRTTLRTFRLKHGNATQVAKILNDIFVGQRSGAAPMPLRADCTGVESAQSRLDSLDRGSSSGSAATTASGSSDNRGANPIAAAFESFSDRKSSEADSSGSSSAASGGNVPRGTFQNMRITADAANNSIVVYSNQEDIGSSSVRYATSTGRSCRYRSMRRSRKSR